MQSRPQTLNGNNNAVSGNNAGTVDENGFSYRDLLQQFQNQSQNSAKKREQDTPTPSKHSTPIKETSAEAMLNNLSFMSGSYNAASRAVLGSGAGKNVESQKVLMGDFNDDGILDTDDVMAIQDHIVEKKKITDPNMFKRMDLNSDGEIDVFDLTKLTNTIIGREGKKYIEIETPKKEPIKGDLNDDGVIDGNDNDLMMDTVMKNYLKKGSYVKAADFDDDGEINVTDLSAFKQALRNARATNSTGIKGDINNDGKVTVSDVNLLNKFFNDEISSAHLYNEDVNGDGELNKDDLESVKNLVKYGKIQKPSGVRGDINNDGVFNFLEDGVALLNRLKGKDTETEIYNEDVNGDGIVNMDDVKAIENIFHYGKTQKPTGIRGDINNDGEVSFIEDGITLLNRLKGMDTETEIYNEDIDGNGVVDMNDFEAFKNLYNYGKMQEPSGIKGDINNDGEVDIFDVTKLNKYLQGKENIENIYNEDVNGDGVVDDNDVKSIENLILYGSINAPEPIAPVQSDPGYQPWTAVVANKMPAYHDAELTDRRNNEEVWVGDEVTILDETDNAYKMQYWSNALGDYKIRWVSKSALEEGINSGYKPWPATIQRNTPAYHDAELTDRRNNEEVWIGDDVTILDETDNAYKMQYWSNALGDYKIRWVSKSA
ncbi:MAG: hypothetical protein IKN43_13870, partial [Selenomonadaceae bacterium]|nr:hypothetical protein [Selenomonadaceae bacterium]